MLRKIKRFTSDPKIRLMIASIILAYGMLAAYQLRIGIWQQEQQRNDNTMMFTLESALLFRYARLSIEGGIPEHDFQIEYPYGVNPYKTFSIGGGVMLAHLYSLLQSVYPIKISLEQFHRYVMP